MEPKRSHGNGHACTQVLHRLCAGDVALSLKKGIGLQYSMRDHGPVTKVSLVSVYGLSVTNRSERSAWDQECIERTPEALRCTKKQTSDLTIRKQTVVEFSSVPWWGGLSCCGWAAHGQVVRRKQIDEEH